MSRITRVDKRADGTYGGRTFMEAVHAARWIVDLTANDDDREAGLRAISWGVVKSAATRRIWLRAAAAVAAVLHKHAVQRCRWRGTYNGIDDVVNTYCNARDTLARKKTVEP